MDHLSMSSHTVQNCTFDELVRAVAAADVHEVSLTSSDFRRFAGAGMTAERMRSSAEAAGVHIVDIEALFGSLEPDPAGRTAAMAQRLLEVADSFGASWLGTHSDFDGDVELAAERLGSLCDRAAVYGVAVGVEPVSVTGLSDLAVAERVIRATGRRNVGLVLDTWHFFRGAGTLDMLSALPGDALSTVQISDGTVDPAPGLDYLSDTLANRLPPGEGELDLFAVVRAVDAIGAEVRWDMEICSTVLDALAPEDAARRSALATVAVLHQARHGVDAGR